MILKKPIAMVALVAVYGASALQIGAQQSTPQARSGSAETSLIGIALFDTGAKVVTKYGSPDDIQALTVGGAGGGTGGGGGAGTAAGRPGGGPAGGGGMEGAAARPDNLLGDPFFQQKNLPGANAPAGTGPPTGGGQGPTNGPTGGPGGGGRGGSVGSQQNSDDVVYTRWVYKRNNSRYAFVFDKFNRVVQIEAIGLSNRSVKTKRGITFGSSFASVIKAYKAPDGYEVNGDHIVVRYLVRDRVAFRMSKVKEGQPHVVTGIVVAAGKP